MNRIKSSLWILLLVVMLAACSPAPYFLDKLQVLRQQADRAPEQTLAVLNDMRQDRDRMPAYAQAKYDVLRLRVLQQLQKPFPTGMNLEAVTTRMEQHGDNREQQEAHYYVGCAYQQIDDVPHALEHLLDATACCEDSEPFDTVLWHDSYSHLYELYAEVGDYGNALYMAQQETKTEGKAPTLATAMHLGVCYYQLEQLPKAKESFRRALLLANQQGSDEASMTLLLHYFTAMGMQQKAEEAANKLKLYTRYGKKATASSLTQATRGKQKLTDAVTKQYQYNRVARAEALAKTRTQRYLILLLAVVLLLIIVVSVGVIIYYRRRNQALLQALALQDARQQLAQRIRQNDTYLRMLHQAEMSSGAADIIETLRRTAEGKHHLTAEEWQQFFHAVDEQYPSFRHDLAQHQGTLDEQALQFCYLLKAGMTSQQIMNIMPLSRTTVWRWNKKYKEII